MPYLNDRVLDFGLNVLDTEATRLDITTALPSTYAEALSLSLGNAAAVVGAPAAGLPSGRKVTVAAVTAAVVTGTGTAAFWAISDASSSRLLAADALAAPQAVTSGNTFDLGAFDITLPGPA